MGTRSKTTIYDEVGKPLISFYRQMDGYFKGHGEELQNYLRNRKICNGYGIGDSEENKVSNGMSCLAASIIAHFKKGIGSIYICSHENEQEYNYDIRYIETEDSRYGRIKLFGKGYDETKRFKLYDDDIGENLGYTQIAEFLYDKDDDETLKLRRIGLYEMDNHFVKGVDLNDGNRYKQFSVKKIIGGLSQVKVRDVN